MPEEDIKSHNTFIYILLFSCFVVVAVSFYNFYLKKDYYFIVETNCDSTSETCFYRDCSIADECPPNNLSYYSKYTINANDFAMCENEDCTNFCKENADSCVKTECTEEDIEGELCLFPESVLNEEESTIVDSETIREDENQ